MDSQTNPGGRELCVTYWSDWLIQMVMSVKWTTQSTSVSHVRNWSNGTDSQMEVQGVRWGPIPPRRLCCIGWVGESANVGAKRGSNTWRQWLAYIAQCSFCTNPGRADVAVLTRTAAGEIPWRRSFYWNFYLNILGILWAYGSDRVF